MSERPSFVLGIDLGTTSIKVVVVDPNTKNVLAQEIGSTDSDVSSEIGPTGHEQDPRRITAAFHRCLAALPASLLQCVNLIGICGQMHGIMLWNNIHDQNKGLRQLFITKQCYINYASFYH